MIIKKSNNTIELLFYNTILFTILNFLLITKQSFLVGGKRLEDLSWDPQSGIFNKNSNIEPVIQVHIMDRIKINCPKARENDRKYKYSKLYAVSREGFEKCSLLNSKIIGTCKNPNLNSSINIVFREVSPLAGALVFKPGEDYYLISTSTGTLEGIDNSEGGLCSTDNMKVKFEIQEKNEQPKSEEAQKIIENKYVGNNQNIVKNFNENNSMAAGVLQSFNDDTAIVYRINNADVEYNEDEIYSFINSTIKISYNYHIILVILFISVISCNFI
uniref:Ephrin (inferred by orthology to a D. melanogaster protein) n=1 Tax=Strongyloides venezuelensis TaxID=75913 RepID=A0A0K0EXI5_STRVS